MPLQHAETPADRDAWARLWGFVRDPWERDADLAEFLGVGRSTIVEWSPGGRNVGHGPWSLLRLALRRTARRYPASVPSLVQALARELLDAEGRWVPEAAAATVGPYAEESADVVDSLAELRGEVRSGDRDRIVAAARKLVEQAEEAARAACAEAK